MFDWAFAAAWRNIVWTLRIVGWIVRGTVRTISAILNRRQNTAVPSARQSNVFDE